jgi:hypothetical protein
MGRLRTCTHHTSCYLNAAGLLLAAAAAPFVRCDLPAPPARLRSDFARLEPVPPPGPDCKAAAAMAPSENSAEGGGSCAAACAACGAAAAAPAAAAGGRAPAESDELLGEAAAAAPEPSAAG